MKKLTAKCVDINSRYCPCLLAKTNHCEFCSHLRGGTVCDCNWSGVCILYEHYWQNKSGGRPVKEDIPARLETVTSFTATEQISANTYLLEFSVEDGLARQLERTGSFVFLRRASDPKFYHFPVGVMQVTGNTVAVVIEAIGPKSVRLMADASQQILVNGPYYNGVLGQPWIDNIRDGKILLVAGGIGQAPALPLVKKLRQNGNEVLAILAPGQVQKIFIGQQLAEWGVQVHTVDSMRQAGIPLLKNLFELKPELVVSSGPDNQHYAVIAAMQEAGINLPMAATNNVTMCCGEGVCGSCHKVTQDNKSVKLCKVQLDFAQLLQE
ncbi:hypothetical protein HSX37_00740|uniref:NAD(P)H-flavin reductase n=1 Tax=Dendrosporobacter quercicolus TaxID=146817 RepID=A0A1G9L343_9FIRM|nr:hypothetical protein [Dendrosporobacter quercicolus]NSL46581.1 hypothetical protein [Dendrosporobacter quercicolus DSM 1736]SDL56418.1 NAD(P)H-flavin reductase [Dendrosporobacter quercicolus]